MSRYWGTILAVIAAQLLLAACVPAPSAAQQPIVIKFSHVVANDTPKGKAALRFKELAETRTQGRVRVEVYANSSLFKDREELEALQLGVVHMLAPSLSKFGPLGVPEFEVFDLPYIFDSYEDLRKVTDGPIGQILLEKLERKGILGLAYWDNGFKVMSANRPLKRPEDFRGLKMRIQPSTVIDSQMRALGAVPQVMAFSEVYQALRSGVVDGTENPVSNLYTQRMHEVQKYVTLSNHGYLGYAVIVNKKFWRDLPNDVRATLEGAMRDATRYANDIAKKENDESLEKVKDFGKTQILTLAPAEKLAWKKALMPLHKQFVDKIGKELIDSIYKRTGFDPGKL